MSYLDKTKLGEVRRNFCEGTGLQSPVEAIEAKVKTLQEWLDVLDKHRLEYPTYTTTTTSEPRAAEKTLRQRILDYLAMHCQNNWGLSVKEISEARNKHNNTIRDTLTYMVEEGLLTTVQVLRERKGNPMLYRIAGIDEVKL
jgi:hypothetical protein